MASLTLSLVVLIIFVIGIKAQGRNITLNNTSFNQLLTSDGLNVDLMNGLFSYSANGGTWFHYILYGILMLAGGHFVTNGSKKLFIILGKGIYGGILHNLLTQFPSIVYVIMSGIWCSKEKAEEQISVGVSIYAGETVYSLAWLWSMYVIYGRRNIFGESFTGITTDKKTRLMGGFMVLSLVPYGILQLVYVYNTPSGILLLMRIALIVSTILLLAYFAYQIVYPWIQERNLINYALPKLREYDSDFGYEYEIEEEFDSGLGYEYVIEEEFIKESISAYEDMQRSVYHNSSPRQKAWIWFIVVAEIISGVAILMFFADPFTDNIIKLFDASTIPTSVVAFFMVPLIMHARERHLRITEARKRSKQGDSLEISEIYDDVIKNNIIGLTTVLAIVYAKELPWNYSAEVLIICFNCLVSGVVGISCTTYPLWTGILGFAVYLLEVYLYYYLKKDEN